MNTMILSVLFNNNIFFDIDFNQLNNPIELKNITHLTSTLT